jgi:hypothetical protein
MKKVERESQSRIKTARREQEAAEGSQAFLEPEDVDQGDLSVSLTETHAELPERVFDKVQQPPSANRSVQRYFKVCRANGAEDVSGVF